MIGDIVDTKLISMMDGAIAQANEELDSVVRQASDQLNANIKLVSDEIHDQ